MNVNRTEEKHRFLIIANPERKGIALVVEKKPSTSADEITYEKKIKQDITYEEALFWGKKAVAFKFIPYDVEIVHRGRKTNFTSFDSISENDWVCRGLCKSPENCGSEVCLCIDGTCY